MNDYFTNHNQSESKANIKLSVLVAVYNVEKYLRQCLDSLVCQKLTATEFIIVDDGSTDQSGLVCDEYAKKDSRIKVIHKNKNEGLLLSRKTGINQAQGEWIVFVDGDDFLPSSDALESLVKIAEHENVDILKFDVEVVGGDNALNSEMKRFLVGDVPEKILKGPIEITTSCYCDRSFSWSLWNKIYRARVLKDAEKHYKCEHFNAAEDAYQFFLFSYFSQSFKSVRTDSFYCYRLGSGITTSQVTLQKFEGYAKEILAIRWLEEFLKSERVFEHFSVQVHSLKKTLTNTIIGRYFQLPENDRKTAITVLKRYYDVEAIRKKIFPRKTLLAKVRDFFKFNGSGT